MNTSRKKVAVIMVGVVGLMVWNHFSIYRERRWVFLDGSEGES